MSTGAQTTVDVGLHRRRLFTMIAQADLPMPDSVQALYTDGRLHGTITLPDNAPDDVDAWASMHEATAAYGEHVMRAGRGRPFRSYSFRTLVSGWEMEVHAFVDVDRIPDGEEA